MAVTCFSPALLAPGTRVPAPAVTKPSVRHRRARQLAPVLTRVGDVPVVAAGSVPGYGPIFNAGVILHEGRYHLFARAVRDGYRRNPRAGGSGPSFLDYVSDVLVFTSPDGLDYSFQKALHRSSPEAVHEDPRIQVIQSGGEPHFLLTYTSVSPSAGDRPWRAGISELTYDDGSFSVARSTMLGPDRTPNKDVVLCNLRDGRIGLIQRLEPAGLLQQTIQVASFDSLEELWEPAPETWERYLEGLREHVILAPRAGAAGVGAGAPPVLVDGELVFFYHSRDRANRYTTRVALLDGDTARVRALLPRPVLSPLLPWEVAGDVADVVFVEGAQLRADGTIYLTYGAADRHVGAATIESGPLLAALHASSVRFPQR